MTRWVQKFAGALLAVAAVSCSATVLPTATLTVTGAETQRMDKSWDVGPFLVTIYVSNYQFAESIYYGRYSTAASVASQIAGAFTRDYMQNGLCAIASGPIVTFKLRGGATFGMLNITGPTSSFQLNGSGFAAYNWAPPTTSGGTVVSTVYMSGGTDTGTYYDTGTLQVRVAGALATVNWTQGSTPSDLASQLATAINTAASGFVNATASGTSVNVSSLNSGPAADMTISAATRDTNTSYFSSPSFSVSTTNMSGGAATESSLLYGFLFAPQGGYDANGNVLSVTDSVMGQWNYAYDNLNRLLSGAAVTTSSSGISNYFAGVQPSWNYDAFGNRTAETWGGTGSATLPTSSTTAYAATVNQVSSSSLGTPQYDAAGDVTADGTNSYLYDAEGRVCAMKNSWNAITGYIYNAAGIRVAKGNLTSFVCDFSPTNYQTTTSWVLGPGGEQVTEYSVSGGTSTWVHTNAFAGGQLLATYNGTDTYFALNDWLGTKRAEVGAGGCFSSFASMPFGNGPKSTGNCPDATEQHFTGKEHDLESGNDYFDARYYSNAMGRFMSPDWSAKEEPIPYAKLDDPQTLNLYSYVRNNPVDHTDVDGHQQSGVISAEGIPIPLPNPVSPVVKYPKGYNLEDIRIPASLPQLQMPKLPSVEEIKSDIAFAGALVTTAVKTRVASLFNKSGADFVVTPGGTAIPTDRDRIRDGFDAAGFPSKPTTQTGETGTLHSVPTANGQIDVRVMDGKGKKEPRVVISHPGTNNPKTAEGKATDDKDQSHIPVH